MTFQAQLRRARVLPVITPQAVELTCQLTATLARGGMSAVEITLRSDSALDCIRAVKNAQPDLLVAAGTVTGPAESTLGSSQRS